MVQISIIVPVFNAEKYLHDCIDSILTQPFVNFELILINDGSTDKSGKICDEYAIKDSRVKVFHKGNGGVSSARNLGLDNAKGEWVTFVDSDDRLAENAFMCFRRTINADFIITSYTTGLNGILDTIYISQTDCLISGAEMMDFTVKYINTTTIKTPWAKFFSNRLLNKLRFDDEIICGEDFLFVLMYLKRVSSIYLVKDSTYIYSIPEFNFRDKYQQTIESSAYTLYRIFGAYKKLNITSPSFECNVFYDYKYLCKEDMYKNPSLWYNDKRVKTIFSSIKKHIGILPRINYVLMCNRIISRILINIWRYLKQ